MGLSLGGVSGDGGGRGGEGSGAGGRRGEEARRTRARGRRCSYVRQRPARAARPSSHPPTFNSSRLLHKLLGDAVSQRRRCGAVEQPGPAPVQAAARETCFLARGSRLSALNFSALQKSLHRQRLCVLVHFKVSWRTKVIFLVSVPVQRWEDQRAGSRGQSTLADPELE